MARVSINERWSAAERKRERERDRDREKERKRKRQVDERQRVRECRSLVHGRRRRTGRTSIARIPSRSGLRGPV